jgi:hypothetical protein
MAMMEYSVELSRTLLRKAVVSRSSRFWRWILSSRRFWPVISRAASKMPATRPDAFLYWRR